MTCRALIQLEASHLHTADDFYQRFYLSFLLLMQSNFLGFAPAFNISYSPSTISPEDRLILIITMSHTIVGKHQLSFRRWSGPSMPSWRCSMCKKANWRSCRSCIFTRWWDQSSLHPHPIDWSALLVSFLCCWILAADWLYDRDIFTICAGGTWRSCAVRCMWIRTRQVWRWVRGRRCGCSHFGRRWNRQISFLTESSPRRLFTGWSICTGMVPDRCLWLYTPNFFSRWAYHSCRSSTNIFPFD